MKLPWNKKGPKPITPFNRCPFQSSQGGPGICDGVRCQLWSISQPFGAAEKTYPNGMCSLKLQAEAQAFISRGNELGGLEGR